MSRTIAFIQARMSSSRFPGKVLEPLGGMPMIVYMARRAGRAKLVDDVVIVTSADSSDDSLADAVQRAGMRVFRGDLNDVLGRYSAAAAAEGATEVIRLTGDCPLIDSAVIDAVIKARRDAKADYSSNVDPPTYPDGLDVECFTRAALDVANAKAKMPAEREHVTLWMRSEAAGLRKANHRSLADFSHIRLTIDYPDDMVVVRRLVSTLGRNGGNFDFYDLLRELAAQPNILDINRHVRNEGLAKSLSEQDSTSANRAQSSEKGASK